MAEQDQRDDGRDATRRAVVAGLAALGAGALLPAAAMALTAPAGKHRRIDVHHHFVPTEVVGSARIVEPLKSWSLQKSLDDMDKGGVATAMLSFTPQILTALANGAPVTPAHFRRGNEFGAQLVADHPGRYGLFAGIPLTDTEASLKEIDYALGTLKADGIGLFTSYGTQWLGNRAFDPVFAELNRRKAVVYTHPTVAPCCGRLIPEINDSEIEYGTDTSRAIASMVFTGASQRFPDIRVIWSHGGGTIPYLIQRFTKDARIDARLAKVLPNGFMPEFQRFYFDIAQIARRPPLLALQAVAPMAHIVFGTDYPYLTAAEHVDGLKQARVFTAQELRAIDANAVALVPRLKA
jgi:predicted TIM-barrel fold metal-dependent hydrolase